MRKLCRVELSCQMRQAALEGIAGGPALSDRLKEILNTNHRHVQDERGIMEALADLVADGGDIPKITSDSIDALSDISYVLRDAWLDETGIESEACRWIYLLINTVIENACLYAEYSDVIS